VRALEEIFVENGVGSLFFAGEDRIANGLKMSLGLWAVIVVGRTTPESLLVELDLLDIRFSIDHCSEVGVTYGQSFQPVTGWLTIP
jgi:hypothetical protein